MSSGSAHITIDRPASEVWAAIADITRVGDWSPECIAGRWVGGATGPTVGAKFEGDNVAKVAGRTIKKWTTTSEVTACEPGVVFEFVAEGYTTWRYDFLAAGDSSTTVTESFDYTAKGFIGIVYDRILFRPKAMTNGMNSTLARVKSSLEQA
ncbi:MAG: SRPBCC family protein [Ilumatobacteraceae bacterium]|nr:SRPBCC family protein [Ilumatobacteraceae bacterium]